MNKKDNIYIESKLSKQYGYLMSVITLNLCAILVTWALVWVSHSAYFRHSWEQTIKKPSPDYALILLIPFITTCFSYIIEKLMKSKTIKKSDLNSEYINGQDLKVKEYNNAKFALTLLSRALFAQGVIIVYVFICFEYRSIKSLLLSSNHLIAISVISVCIMIVWEEIKDKILPPSQSLDKEGDLTKKMKENPPPSKNYNFSGAGLKKRNNLVPIGKILPGVDQDSKKLNKILTIMSISIPIMITLIIYLITFPSSWGAFQSKVLAPFGLLLITITVVWQFIFLIKIIRDLISMDKNGLNIKSIDVTELINISTTYKYTCRDNGDQYYLVKVSFTKDRRDYFFSKKVLTEEELQDTIEGIKNRNYKSIDVVYEEQTKKLVGIYIKNMDFINEEDEQFDKVVRIQFVWGLLGIIISIFTLPLVYKSFYDFIGLSFKGFFFIICCCTVFHMLIIGIQGLTIKILKEKIYFIK